MVAGIGEMLRMRVRMECVASSNTSALPPALTNSPSLASKSVQFQGEMALKCFQDLQNGKPVVDRMENLVVCGVKRRQFNLKMDPNVSLFCCYFIINGFLRILHHNIQLPLPLLTHSFSVPKVSIN